MTDDEVIRALYETLLLRLPDPTGLNDKLDAMATGRQDIGDIIRTMLCSQEFAQVHPSFRDRYLGTTLPFTNDHSQFGEVALLIKEIVNQAATHRLLVDVGARGRNGSNSYDLLHVFGWRGLLIEANPQLIDGLHRDFAGLDTTIVNCAVSNYSGDGVLHLGVNDDVSSLQQQNAAGWGPTRGRLAVSVRRLGEILTEQAIPRDFDLLSLDIEGEDVAVFNDLIESGYRPQWVIIEASYNFQTRSLEDVPFSPLVRDHYMLVAQTEPNLILCLIGRALTTV
jgi:FkbM family methyltransferase